MIEGAEFKDKLPWLRQVIKLEREKDESLKQYDASILFPLYYGWSIENIQERILKLIEGRAEEFYSYFKFNNSDIEKVEINNKFCIKCKINKKMSDYYSNKYTTDKLCVYCKSCDNEQRMIRKKKK